MQIKRIVAVIGSLLLILVITVFIFLYKHTTEQPKNEGFYLSFLTEHSDPEWHTMWQQLWNLSDKVTVPKSAVSMYGSDEKEAEKIIELIASYGFWVDDSDTKGQYAFSADSSTVTITGVKYFSNAGQMQKSVEYELQKVFSQVYVKGDQLKTLSNINQYLYYNTVYSEDSSTQGQTIYSALVDHKAVCGGFARTFNTLALLSGVDSHITVGYLVKTTGNVRHAWNTYIIDGCDYVSDSTRNRTSGKMDKVLNRAMGAFYTVDYATPELHAEALHLISK